MSPTLSSPLRDVVGGKTAKAFETGLGLHTVADLLRHYPRRREPRGVLTKLAELQEGEQVTIQAEVVKADARKMRNRRGTLVEVVVTDGTAQLRLTFFNQSWRASQLRPGQRGLFTGKVSTFNGRRQLAQPQTQLLDDDREVDESKLSRLLAFYSSTAALPTWTIANAVRIAYDMVDIDDDPLPEDLRERRELLPLREALRLIHFADTWEEVRRAELRLKWDEAFVLQVALAQSRAAIASQPATPREPKPDGLLAEFDRRLPFALTEGQQRVSADIFADLARSHPMHRLLQGEVGSGKTVVALRAMLAVVDSGGQAALLAPTEVLAQQHFRTLQHLLGPLAQAGQLGGADNATKLALLTGSQGAKARRENLLDAASGAAGIVVGTHALLEEHVQFADLGLVVVDEQHRFGVEQRDALRAKGSAPPHVLVMTATPIPRTVAMTVYGDLETSELKELPKGRAPIDTQVVALAEHPHWIDRVWKRIGEDVANGRQAYVVCPRIDANSAEADDDDEGAATVAAAVSDIAPMLATGPLSAVRVEQLHGRMAADAKDDVMRRFTAGDVEVLVATTVIEVGVDVPNASVMAVLDADRFGVSQLHQLRGRIGRGSHAGLCLLVTHAPAESPARERVDGVAATLDGFELARLDLQQRREGDVLGASQSGRTSLKLLRLLQDEDLIVQARVEATDLVAADPALDAHPALAAMVGELVDTDRAEYLEKA